jgi:hypothetical protein
MASSSAASESRRDSLLRLGIRETDARQMGPGRRAGLEACAAHMTIDEGIALALAVVDEHFPTAVIASP